MTDQLEETPAGSAKNGGSGSKVRQIGQSIVRNPLRAAQVVFFLLVAIIILQNFETTEIDILFWNIAALPKLVLIFLSMIVGAVAWEVLRRLKR